MFRRIFWCLVLESVLRQWIDGFLWELILFDGVWVGFFRGVAEICLFLLVKIGQSIFFFVFCIICC